MEYLVELCIVSLAVNKAPGFIAWGKTFQMCCSSLNLLSGIGEFTMKRICSGIFLFALVLVPLQQNALARGFPQQQETVYSVTSTQVDAPPIPTAWPWSKRIAESFVLRHPGSVTYDSLSPNQRWNYEQGLMLVALRQMWLLTKDQRYFDFIKRNIGQYVDESGLIKTLQVPMTSTWTTWRSEELS